MSMTPEQTAAALAELDIDSSDKKQNKVASSCETKQGDTNATSHSNAESHLSYLVQPNLHGKPQRLPSLQALWIRIFSYSGLGTNRKRNGAAPLFMQIVFQSIETIAVLDAVSTS